MARYDGPRLKIIRRFQTALPGLTRKSAERRPYPPGQHGTAKGRARVSAYGLQLAEKQKVRMNYGISERQMRSYFRRALALRGDTGQNLLMLLERRLDNVVFRAGFAPTIPSARQLVTHGHVLVNGRRVDIPSYSVRPGEVLTVREGSRKIPVVVETIHAPSLAYPSYLEVSPEAFQAKLHGAPAREDTPLDIQENLIVELYSRYV